MRFGIIGFGRFGQCWAQALLPFGEVMVYDDSFKVEPIAPLKKVTLKEAASADIVFPLVPISEFEKCCQQIKTLLNPQSLLVDCCSVKVYPAKVMEALFPKTQAMIASHPLFGPDSVQKTGGLKGHKIVVCPLSENEHKCKMLTDIFQKMGLDVIITIPEDHDRQMANSQSLVHFIGRGLTALNLHPQILATPDFQALLNINSMVTRDTFQLFLDMQRYNPYAKNIRQGFIDQLVTLNKHIEEDHALSELDALRNEVEKIDESIIQKLRERKAVSLKIGEIKRREGGEIVDPKREEHLRQFHEKLSLEYGLESAFVLQIFDEIMGYSRKVQKL